MKTAPSPGQLALEEALSQFLDEEVAQLVRRMAYRSPHSLGGEDNREVRAMVHQGLVDLGVPRLPLPAAAGGTEGGQEDLAVVAEQLGAVLYQGLLADTLTAAELLARCGDAHLGLLRRIGEGATIALAVRSDAPGATTTTVPAPLTVDRARGTLTATRAFVPFAGEADHLLVLGTDTDGRLHAALADPRARGISRRLHEELGRGELYALDFAGTPVTDWLDLGEDPAALWRAALDGARVRHAALLTGVSRGALRLSVERARERRQFGRPIGHQQALALRLAELAARVDAVGLVVRAAAWEADRPDTVGAGTVRLSAAQALAMAAQLARRTAGEAMQIHGAYGMTEDSDAQLFYRRAAVESLWLGSPAELLGEAASLLGARIAARPRRAVV
ncbi:acyl-CoA dehydrogenase family protein [Streptomyces sp. CSDS2]|uniref:acyl-CoA dehydrogenase family protein n=1 Tax=Streptomyces sp. CSDS2 TaxID=3055051 RepID=UPI0025AEF931|nr:acyl-CoA dehydrogenase family protein [Streptomyces sp. CSDS2]MDN3259809.1 acyl-CoA dehydrogenase family protein [Streptomyces sp. CSDS2]